MTYIRVKITGDGTPGNPLRAPLPNFSFVADMGAGMWVVDVRPEDAPVPAGAPSMVIIPNIGAVSVLTTLDAQQTNAWLTHLNRLYPARDRSAPLVVQ